MEGPQQLFIDPIPLEQKSAGFETTNYTAAYQVLAALNLPIVGVDFVEEERQLDGRRPPSWRAYHRSAKTTWPCVEQADQWSFIAHAAIQRGNGLLWDVARRISSQLRTCDWRLRQVSECYRDQLLALMKSGNFKTDVGHSDGFTWFGYLAIQSFLVDAGVLRDELAEYRAVLLVQSGARSFASRITGLGSLKRQYIDQETLAARADRDLAAAANEGGWLKALGEYRDLVVHCAPLKSAGKGMHAFCSLLPVHQAFSLGAVKLPIPADPAEIMKSRHSGEYWDDPSQNYARYLNALKDPAAAEDGLQYAHSVLGKLAQMAASLGELSPVAPEIPTITEKDIISLEVDGQSIIGARKPRV
jgi:hypothetical protein